MKTRNKIIAISVAALLFVSALICTVILVCRPNGAGSGEGASSETPVYTVTAPEEHKVAGTLHKVSVTPSERLFVTKEGTEYEFVLGRADGISQAAALINEHVNKATGFSFKTRVKSTQYSVDAKYIVIGDETLFCQAQLTMPQDDLGTGGYYIKTVGNSVFIMAYSLFGYQNGAVSFLNHVVGYTMYTLDTVEYAKSGATLPEMEIAERPDFDYRIQGNKTSSTADYGMGMQAYEDVLISVGEPFHNTFYYLPPATYNNPAKRANYHPNWFANEGVTDRTAAGQVCYTAHGNAEDYRLMVELVAQKMIQAIDANPNKYVITFTQEDIQPNCSCKACVGNAELYGGAYSANIVMFLNEVDEIVYDYYLQQADGDAAAMREYKILFFAYTFSLKPPAKRNSDGSYSALASEVTCRRNVGAYIAPIGANYYHSFYESENDTIAANIAGWGACTDVIYFWLYETNFSHYLYFFNTFDTMIESYRFCRRYSGEYMFNEGQINNGAVTGFGRLKEYFNSAAMFDVNCNYSQITDDFFRNYFRDAAASMRSLFEQMQMHCRKLEREQTLYATGNIYTNLEQAAYWPKKKLDAWLALIDEAYAAIEHYKTDDPSLYIVLKNHIKTESIFPRYALLNLHSGSFTPDQRTELRKAFRDDCKELGFTQYSETQSLDTVWSSWGI